MRDSGEGKNLAPFRKFNQNKLVIAHININSLRNKFELLTEKTKGNVDILVISETKINESFPDSQLKIDGCSSPHRIDCNEKGGRIMLLFREDLPVKVLAVDKGNESCFVEVILKKTKWLINYSYNSTKNNISSHLESLSRNLHSCTSKFENILMIGDLNISMQDNNIKHLCESYNLKSLTKVPTCYKNPEIQSCIDLILTNKPRNFQNSCVIEISLSDFHNMTVTALRMQFRKLKPRVLFYRDYTKFSNETYINSLKVKLYTQFISPDQNGFLNVCNICTETLNKHAPCKRKAIR